MLGLVVDFIIYYYSWVKTANGQLITYEAFDGSIIKVNKKGDLFTLISRTEYYDSNARTSGFGSNMWNCMTDFFESDTGLVMATIGAISGTAGYVVTGAAIGCALSML